MRWGLAWSSLRTLETVRKAGQGQPCLDSWVIGKQKRAQGREGGVEITKRKGKKQAAEINSGLRGPPFPGPESTVSDSPGKCVVQERPAAGNWC